MTDKQDANQRMRDAGDIGVQGDGMPRGGFQSSEMQTAVRKSDGR